jgi:hypothetical protein
MENLSQTGLRLFSFNPPLSPFIKGGLRGIIKKEEMVVDENFLHDLYEDQ